jgi:hypothetical protein
MFSIAKSTIALPLLAGVISFASLQTSADAAAVRTGFTGNTLPGNDDGSTGSVALPFSLNFFGNNFSSLFVNNNGNVTFNAPLGTFTPFPILTTNTPMLAPFFADVDTRGAIPDVTYGTGTVGGLSAFGVNWLDVGYYNQNPTPSNSFQLVIIDRSDISPGDFDFEFNYDRILWETGEASGGNSSGLGGSSARAGWSNGTTTSYELTGSAVNGALLDGGPNALINDSLNSNVDGRYVFQVRNGVVVNTPEGGQTLALLGLGLLSLAGVRKALVRK